jgi:hypothetical protein
MIWRLKDKQPLDVRLKEPDIAPMVLPGFDSSEWIEQPGCYTLTNGKDLLLVEVWADGVREIHWGFRSRGREAIEAGVDFLRHLFHKEDARIVVGTVPAHKRAARWFSRQVGGTSNGIVQTELGPMEVFRLTREDFEAQHEFPRREI